MNIGKKTSWQVAAVVAAALFAGGVQAHDRDSNRHGQRHQARHHDQSRHNYRHHDDRYERRHNRGHRHDRNDSRGRNDGYYGREYGYQNRQLIDELERLAPPFSPPWLYRHGLLPR